MCTAFKRTFLTEKLAPCATRRRELSLDRYPLRESQSKNCRAFACLLSIGIPHIRSKNRPLHYVHCDLHACVLCTFHNTLELRPIAAARDFLLKKLPLPHLVSKTNFGSKRAPAAEFPPKGATTKDARKSHCLVVTHSGPAAAAAVVSSSRR